MAFLSLRSRRLKLDMERQHMHLKYGVEQFRDGVCSFFYTKVYHAIKVVKL